MSTNTNSNQLRQLAGRLVDELAQARENEILQQTRDDLITSLVRQWLTYDGNAVLFVDDQRLYFLLDMTPLGKPTAILAMAPPGWLNRLIADGQICPEGLPEAVAQLNRGQSAEVTSRDGVPMRLWANPKERQCGIEPLVKRPVDPGWQRDHHKIAGDLIELHFGESVDAEEREQLICSVAQQWQKYQGHACLFNGNEQLVFTITEREEGNCVVGVRRLLTKIEAFLGSLGFAAEVIPELLARINLDEEIEFVNRQGIHSFLRHDPLTQKINIRSHGTH